MRRGFNLISVWFGMIMILGLVTGAIGIAFTDVLSDSLYGKKRIFFIILLLSYSVYRGIRIYQVLKQNRHEN